MSVPLTFSKMNFENDMTYSSLCDIMILQLKAAKDLKKSVIKRLVNASSSQYISSNPEYTEACKKYNYVHQECLGLLEKIKIGIVSGDDLVI